jgi:hypothetical protein
VPQRYLSTFSEEIFVGVSEAESSHALFDIKTVIIPRNRYRPEGFSPRVDIGRGMITVLIWKKTCINLFIIYFNIELKRTKLTSHTDTKQNMFSTSCHPPLSPKILLELYYIIFGSILRVIVKFFLPLISVL